MERMKEAMRTQDSHTRVAEQERSNAESAIRTVRCRILRHTYQSFRMYIIFLVLSLSLLTFTLIIVFLLSHVARSGIQY